jgi:hypothetical protein
MSASRLNIQYLEFRARSWLPGDEKVLTARVTTDVQGEVAEHLSTPIRNDFRKFYPCPHLCEGTLQKLHSSFSDLGLAALAGCAMELPRHRYC